MTPDETFTLLREVSAMDRWFKSFTRDEAAQMVKTWSHILGDVPAAFAITVAHRHYAKADVRSIQPGDIADAWRRARDRQVAEARQIEARVDAERVLGEVARLRPSWYDAYAAEFPSAQEWMSARAAHAAARRTQLVALRARADAVPPITAWLSAHPEHVMEAEGPRLSERPGERACGVRNCACTHTECRGGWDDKPGRARRCPICEDAVNMIGEPV